MEKQTWRNWRVLNQTMVACGVIKEPAPCTDGVHEGGELGMEGSNGDDGDILWDSEIAVIPMKCSRYVYSGYYGPRRLCYMRRVLKLSIHLNLFILVEERYGPFGEEIGTYFTSNYGLKARWLGFHGRRSAYMDAIGVHMHHTGLEIRDPRKPSMFKIFG
ncbi:hypothetical protein NC652_014846 [Populus alba x Populus x berolinensis]|nr:hypothetical protein NC652_014846 [Populus alba x Populus x berolinensis]